MAITQMNPDEGPLTALVARRVRGLLGELDMDRQALGPILGVSGSSASKRVRGDMPFALDELPVVAEALGTSVGYLLGLTDARRASSTGVNEALLGSVRHEGLEPPTRWFRASERALTPVEAPLATVLQFRPRTARGMLLGGANRPAPTTTTERAS